jgi:hypothetical protein
VRSAVGAASRAPAAPAARARGALESRRPLLQQFRATRNDVAVALDEFGGAPVARVNSALRSGSWRVSHVGGFGASRRRSGTA